MITSNEISKGKNNTYLKVEGLKTQFFTSRGIVKALDGINLTIQEGEIFGLVGESGCGKSVTAQSIMYLIPDPPGRIVKGRILVDGVNILSYLERLAKITIKSETNVKIKRNKRLIKRHNYLLSGIRGSKISMIFQEPTLALNPVIRVGDQISENILLHQKAEIANAIIRRERATRKDYEEFVGRVLQIEDKDQRRKEIRSWCESYSIADAEDLIRNVFAAEKNPEFLIKTVELLVNEWKTGANIQRLKAARDYYIYQQKMFDATLRLMNAESTKDEEAIAQAKSDFAAVKKEGSSFLSFRLKNIFMRKRTEAPLKDAARRRVIELLKLVSIPEPERTAVSYPHELSGGMQQRVMIAMALASNPKLLIADEPTTALDVTTQAQILDLIKNLNREFGSSVLFITHDLAVIAQMCTRVGVMYAGNIVEEADVITIFDNPKHPYTIGLLKALPRADRIAGKMVKLETISGSVPNLITPPTGCRFHPRCKFRMPICEQKKPELDDIGGGHKVACFLYQEPGGPSQ
ncbi:MAG: ATP-binding cassette domain-containing protein [Thermoplasmatales archaeon]